MHTGKWACEHQSKVTCEHFIIKAKTNVSRLSTKQVNIQACDHESIHAYKHLSIHARMPLISQSPQHSSIVVNAFECTNVQLHDHFSLQTCDHKSIDAYEHLSTQVHISLLSQSPQQSSTIINAFECTKILLHNHFSLWPNIYFVIKVCAHVCGYQTCEYQCMWACNYQSIST